MSTRRRARELALRALYAAELSQSPIADIIQNMFKKLYDKDHSFEFCVQLVEITYAHCTELDSVIKQKALNWDFNRIAIIDKIIMRMAMCEFIYFEDIPPKVSIDEAIEISKKYSTDKSGKFINGILDSVLSEWKTTNKIHKSGRGLIDIKKEKNEPFHSSISKSEKI